MREADQSSTARLLRVVQSGGTLFGLRKGCDEWRATPVSGEDSHCTGGRCASVRFESGIEEGRIYGFTAALRWGDKGTELEMWSRGSWSPAPGVVLKDPDRPGWGTIGSGSYCVETAPVTDSPTTPDAVSIGHETWYLTKESCIRDQSKLLAVRGCGTASGKSQQRD